MKKIQYTLKKYNKVLIVCDINNKRMILSKLLIV